MTQRFVAKYEPGNDYGVWDTVRQIFVAGGLERDEADDAAKSWNSSMNTAEVNKIKVEKRT